MIRNFLDRIFINKRLIRPVEFVLKMALVYTVWRTFKYFGEQNENFLWGGWTVFKDMLGNSTTATAAILLGKLGYQLTYYSRMITVDDSAGIFFGDLCLGIAPIVIFSGFILSFGNNWKNKLWFIPLGVFFIYFINVFRLMALVLIQVHHQEYFDMAHDYLYVIITYGFIFLMVMWWMDKLADKKLA